ncbi:MAG TPA: 50S ribosomal protein L24 [Thermodesulfobacteriota bacterium]|nr:50S ribosomal protein L24 [Thermodesulfobacteriota bacterium]
MEGRQVVSTIRKDDTVQVIAGKEKGKTGRVLRVLPKKGRVLVEHINIVKRHTRPSPVSKGGILEKEAPIAISNVMPVCPKCNRPTRVGRARLPDGTPVRVCRKCGEQWEPVRPKPARKK